jgi:iron complex outermembrane receptor protein
MKIIPIPSFTFIILLSIPYMLYSQSMWTVSGTVTDANTLQVLPGASIVEEGTTIGTTTDHDGYYHLTIPVSSDSAILTISYVGYEDVQVKIGGSSASLQVAMISYQLAAKEIVVTASRISETIMEAPVSILKMDANAVKATPSENFYSALPGYKGVDVITNSLLYKTINTRGFNNNANFRLAQLIDGVDNSLPGLGWPLGNVLGATDLDIEKVELIPGPASALYGANAFNGLIYMTTKDPFRYQGLSVQIKNGLNHIGTDLHDPALYTDLQFRYAKAINDRFAFKVNVGYIQGSDWLLTDSTDLNTSVAADQLAVDNPARDAVNIYGDEKAVKSLVSFTTATDTIPVDVSRTGYYLSDLIDNSTYSFKANAGLNYKLNDRLALSYTFDFAQATTSYSSLFYLKNILMYTNKLELSGTHFFIRGAYLADDLGDTYNASVLANAINNSWKKSGVWFSDFAKAYNGGKNFDLARAYADSGRLIPGTDAFNQAMDNLLSIPFSSGGAKVIDRSSKYIFQGEYNFSSLVKFINLVAGANYQLTRLNSEGTIFIDTVGQPILVNQYAGYAQATKEFFKDHLKLLAALRYDKADNFKGVWSPRFAAVYHPDDKNYFRASYQQGFRLPDPQLQYMDIPAGINTRRIGGTAIVDAPYNSRYNSFTEASTLIFNSFVDSLIKNSIPLDSAVKLSIGLLQQSPYDYIQPEQVQTFEVGYRRLLFNEKIYFDINYFHNDYSEFIFSTTLVQPDSGSALNADSFYTAALAVYKGGIKNFVTVVNSDDKVTVDGIEAGMSVVLPKGYVVSGNFTWIHSNIVPGQLAGIRTPPFKSNVSVGNPHFVKNLGFMVNWRWTDAVNNWANSASGTIVDNNLPAYNIIDAQLSYRVPKAATTIKAGASNLLNFYHQDYAQGISVGGIYYVSLLYDGIFK